MKRFRIGIATLVAWLAGLGGGRLAAQACLIDPGTDLQSIDGFGFCTTWSPVMTDAQAGQLFGTGPGQFGFTLLRVYIDENGGFGGDAANAAYAHSYGAKVLGTAWTPPPGMKTSNSSVGGSLLASQYGPYASYLANAANVIGLDLVSFQNEPDITVTYQSCFWTPAQMESWCDNFAAMVGRPIVMPESYHFDDAYSDPTLNDPAGVGAIAYVAGHLYGGGNYVHANAIAHGKHVWMTEHFNYGQDLATALLDAKEVSDCLNNQFNAYLWWHAYHADLTTLDLMDGTSPLLNGSAIGQFSHWIRPGMVRCAANYNPQRGVYVTAFHHPGLVVVALNLGGAPVQQSFTIQNASVASLVPYQTGGSYSRQLTPLDPIAVAGNAFSFTLGAETVTTFVSFDSSPPVILAQPADEVVFPGSAFNLSVQAAGPANTCQWYRNGSALAGQTRSVLAVPTASAADAGTYSAVVTNVNGTVTTRAASIRVEPDASRLVNLSCEAQLGAGQVGTVGFFIAGTGSKQVLIRAAGPALTTFGVTNAMPDPQLRVFQGANVIAQNSQWAPSAIGPAFGQVGAFPYANGSRDAAVLATLAAGQGYTVQASSVSGGGGTVLVEVYDADSGSTASRLANLSARGTIAGSSNPSLTIGFALAGAGSRDVLIRGAGPALAALGVTDALPDPQLVLFDSTAQPVATNYGWATADSVSALATAMTAVSAFPFASGSHDAAALVSLAPSLYTAQVASASHATGEVVAEVYAAP